MMIEADLEQRAIDALSGVLAGEDVQLIGSRLGQKIEDADKLSVVAVASGFRTHDAFSLSLVDIPIVVSVATRVEGDAASVEHNRVVEKIVDALVNWHKHGDAMQAVFSSTMFLAGELRMTGGNTQAYDKDKGIWSDSIGFNVRGSEKFKDVNKTYFLLTNGSTDEFDFVGDVSRSTMVARGYFDDNNMTWLKDMTEAYIGTDVTSIGFAAFDFNTTLERVSIPATVTSIGDFAFGECANLEGKIVIPDAATSIGEQAFTSCEKLTGITVGSGVTSIGMSAFYGCSSLQRIVFRGKTIEQVQAMDNYPWGANESIIQVQSI